MKQYLVNKPLLPDLNEFIKGLNEIWKNNWVTNNGPFVKQLEEELKKYLDVEYIVITNNGTIALMMAIKKYITSTDDEVITTPFSFPATRNAILWAGAKPVYADIEYLNPKENENFIYCTFGGGGHSLAILSKNIFEVLNK
jgi:dTDP-4-amino-4,6-dideoxygalactose transaminase